jgi:hypothetical protein
VTGKMPVLPNTFSLTSESCHQAELRLLLPQPSPSYLKVRKVVYYRFAFTRVRLQGGGLLSEVIRRFCVVRSEGDSPPLACSQIMHVKANPYKNMVQVRL